MHFHLPKPQHGWRALAGEVGIIVVGVLIALAAEQLVESWHWRAQAADARTALRAEIGRDNLPQAYTRLAIGRCLSDKLDQLDAALAADMARPQFIKLAEDYRPPNRGWDDEAWAAVIGTGVLSHGGPGELINWSKPYRIIVALRPKTQAEADEAIDLAAISPTVGAMTPAEADRTAMTLHRLRRHEEQIEISSRVLIQEARETGVLMTAAQQRQVLAQLRPEWGECVSAPDTTEIDLGTQSDEPVRKATLKRS
ncbi:MAG TPA: hypothetical protein VN713_07090 [Sphingomicrobium sp.]|nr:hypothetical protein [Sphingomicrobium sp.]